MPFVKSDHKVISSLLVQAVAVHFVHLFGPGTRGALLLRSLPRRPRPRLLHDAEGAGLELVRVSQIAPPSPLTAYINQAHFGPVTLYNARCAAEVNGLQDRETPIGESEMRNWEPRARAFHLGIGAVSGWGIPRAVSGGDSPGREPRGIARGAMNPIAHQTVPITHQTVAEAFQPRRLCARAA